MGPLHGGANVAVIRMLQDLIASGESLESFVNRVKTESNVRLMGFGHRVYRNFDPRAKIIKEACHNVLNTSGGNEPLLDLAIRLEEVALNDEYFVARKLYPNVDYYSGLIMRAIGIPVEMFTVMFAIGRAAGLDSPLARGPHQSGFAHRQTTPDLHRSCKALLCTHRTAGLTQWLDGLLIGH